MLPCEEQDVKMVVVAGFRCLVESLCWSSLSLVSSWLMAGICDTTKLYTSIIAKKNSRFYRCLVKLGSTWKILHWYADTAGSNQRHSCPSASLCQLDKVSEYLTCISVCPQQISGHFRKYTGMLKHFKVSESKGDPVSISTADSHASLLPR